jgi:Ca-activated chloride channel family protein
VGADDAVDDMAAASDDTRFAVAVAALGQKLRGQSQVAGYGYDDVIALANGAKGEDSFGYRGEFVGLARSAQALDREAR